MKRSLRQTERIKKKMLDNAKARAERRNVPFDLTAADIEVPTNCPLTDIPLISNLGSGGRQGGRYNAPTLDRVIPEYGYVRGNVRVISHLANSMMWEETNPKLLSKAAITFAERVADYFNEEKLNADIDSRYRDGSFVTEFDSNLVPSDQGSEYPENTQLSLPLDSGGN